MDLEIVTPDGAKLHEEVSEITARSVLGELGILPGHIPVLTVLDVGRLEYTAAGGEHKSLAVGGGFFEVSGNRIIVITESAEFGGEIDAVRAQEAKDRTLKELSELVPGTDAWERRNRALKRAETRLEVAQAE